VLVSWATHQVDVVAVFDGEVNMEDRESMACVETEMIAGLADEDRVTLRCVRIDAPQPIPNLGTAVYQRRET
jgi:hypothetical protein